MNPDPSSQPAPEDIAHHYAGVFILTDTDKVIGQQRDDIPTIDNPSKIGTFGGTVEPGETPQEAAWRELVEEETNLVLELDDIKPFTQYVAWRVLTEEWEVAHFFTVTISEADIRKLEVYEGQGWAYITSPSDPTLVEPLRPAVEQLFQDFNLL